MKNTVIMFLLLISVLALGTTIAFADSGWTGQSSGTINDAYGWQIMSDYFFAGNFNAGGVYSDGAWFSDAGHAVPVSSDGNFSLSIPFRIYNSSEIVFVGISTASDRMDNRGWMLIGCPLGTMYNGEMGVAVNPYMDNTTQNLLLDKFYPFYFTPAYGTLYTAVIQSTDGGKTAIFSVGGHSMTLPLSGTPQNVIVYLDNGGYNPAYYSVPRVYNISYLTSGFTPLPPPTSNTYTVPLKQGWNLVSFPLVGTIKASSLKNTGVEVVSAYNRSTGAYDSYDTEVSPLSYDITLKTDMGYFVYATKATSILVNGQSPVGRSTTLYPGWNMIGWSSLSGSTAKHVAGESSLSGSDIISRFNAATGAYDSYAEGISPDSYDFSMQPGTGYFMYSDAATPETLYYEG